MGETNRADVRWLSQNRDQNPEGVPLAAPLGHDPRLRRQSQKVRYQALEGLEKAQATPVLHVRDQCQNG